MSLRPSPRGLFRDMKQDRIAFDRSASARSVNADGHMRVASSAVSRACVNEYWGSEIPGADELGLKPDKVYRLYRHPDELKRAASTLNGKPLMATHRPQSANNHDYSTVVGSLDNAKWDPPFLRSDLTVWAGDGISLITSGRQRQLSCAYRYTPVMKSGIAPDGSPYDGIMKDLEFNHCALVEAGRAGPECMVGDSALRKPRKGIFKLAMDDEGEGSARDRLLDFLASCNLSGRAMLGVLAILDGESGDDAEQENADPEVAADRVRQVNVVCRRVQQRKMAADSASRAAFEKMFPHANRLL